MYGSETTSGWGRKRASLGGWGMRKTWDCKIAVEQKAISREVSEASMPTRDLNHWRSSSTREISAMGVLQTNEASRVRSSKDCSGSVSRMAYFSKAAILPCSLSGLAMTMSHLLRNSLVRAGSWPGEIILQIGERGGSFRCGEGFGGLVEFHDHYLSVRIEAAAGGGLAVFHRMVWTEVGAFGLGASVNAALSHRG